MNQLLRRAKDIHGWMRESELEWLHNAAVGRSLVIEMGTWHGRGTMALLAAERVVCLDAWSVPDGLQWSVELMRDGLPFEVFERNHHDHIAQRRVIPYVVDMRSSVMMSVIFARYGGAADMVFVDADHSRDGVVREISHAKTLCRRGGLICGHDYGERDWPDVKAVVDEIYPHAERGAGSIWYVTHE